MNWIPFFSLTVASISAIIGILTYLRVTRKYVSKALPFHRRIEPKGEQVIFVVKGIGVLQRVEMTANGTEDPIIMLSVDDSVFLKESLGSLYDRESKFMSEGSGTNVEGIGQFNLEMDLQKNFFKNINYR